MKSLNWNESQVELLKKTYAKDLSEAQFEVFLMAAQATGLNPFTRQIYAIIRGGRLTIQTAIDGFRAIASRTGTYAGQDETRFDYKDKSKFPDKATVTVYKVVQGLRCAFTATAKWEEYFPGQKAGQMWLKMPETMLSKCAEAKALRMAFPEAYSGLYVEEEMARDRFDEGKLKDLNQKFDRIEAPQRPEHPDEITLDVEETNE